VEVVAAVCVPLAALLADVSLGNERFVVEMRPPGQGGRRRDGRRGGRGFTLVATRVVWAGT
jgi:hypothetical protein